METRPKINISLTSADKLVERLGWIVLIICWVIAFYSYFTLPEIIPIHFDGAGNVNNYGNKLTIFLLPFIGTGVFIGLSILNNYPEIFNYPRKITEENALQNYTNATRMMRYLKLSIALVFTLVTFMINMATRGYTQGLMLIVPILLAIIFTPLIYFIYKFFNIK